MDIKACRTRFKRIAKQTAGFLLCTGFAVWLCACSADVELTTPEENSRMHSEPEVSEMENSRDPRVPLPSDAEMYTNLTYANPGKMGDNDGPAVCVYAKPGFFRASLDAAVSGIQMQTLRADGRFVNAYIFLGVDITDPEGGYWVNCFDAGLVRSGGTGAWHLFYNVYETADGGSAWYESTVKLADDHDYRPLLDTSGADGKAVLTVIDTTTGAEADRVSFTAAKLLCDGSNTAYYQNFALDFPDDLKIGADGNPGAVYDAADWPASILYSSDEGLYMQNICVADARLYGPNGEAVWDETVTEALGLWPDRTVSAVDYACTYVVRGVPYSAYRIDLDMNRNT